jgi:hypothetical protein
MALAACSGDNGNDCKYACEQARATGPYIEITHNGTSIAAIETLGPGSASNATSLGGCAVSWSSLAGSVGQAEPVCPAPPIDAGWAVDACAKRYPCAAPNGYQLDGGFACTQAWIDMDGDSCAVTVISTTGERQTFEAAVVGTSFAYRCRTGMDQCIDVWSIQTAPSNITITFASPNGGATVADGGNATN